MSRNRLSRQQMLGLLLTAVLGALAVLIAMLAPRRRAIPEPVCSRADTIVAAPAAKHAPKARRQAAPPPAPRRHLDETF